MLAYSILQYCFQIAFQMCITYRAGNSTHNLGEKKRERENSDSTLLSETFVQEFFKVRFAFVIPYSLSSLFITGLQWGVFEMQALAVRKFTFQATS